MSQPEISIVIPVFNREHLVSETLDSIRAQVFSDWECLLIDDGSTDNTVRILETYAADDHRFGVLRRPSDSLKGANTCRNLGLEKAKGRYIVLFDSDDLMTPDHLDIKYKAISENDLDFVITRTRFINADKELGFYKRFDHYSITAHNFISQVISWLTYDTIIRADLARSVQFNPVLKSGQEFNYYSKLVLRSVNAVFLDKVVTLRRKHDDSIRGTINHDRDKVRTSVILSCWVTYEDTRGQLEDRTAQFLLLRILKQMMAGNLLQVIDKKAFVKALNHEFGFLALYLRSILLIKKITNGGYFLLKRMETRFTAVHDIKIPE